MGLDGRFGCGPVGENNLASGTIWHSAAQVRDLRHSQNLSRMIPYSVVLCSQLEEETGQNVGWIQKGSLSIAKNPDRLIHVKWQAALHRAEPACPAARS